MITEIGITAGCIWEFLDKNESARISKLCMDLEHPRDLILMSLGWLARKGYVIVEQDKQDCMVYLRKTGAQKSKNRICPDFRTGEQNLCLVSQDVSMAPSIFELRNFCLSSNYENCPWKMKVKSASRNRL